MEDDKIYLDKAGYDEYWKEIEKLRKQLLDNSKEKSDAYAQAVGDGWHDNFGFEQAMRDEDRIFCEIRRRVAALDRIQIIEKENNPDLVELDDYVVLRLQYEDEDEEEETFKITGSGKGNISSDIIEITLNSPIGSEIYHKPVGYKSEFEVYGSKNKLEIIKIAKTLEELKTEEQGLNEQGPVRK